MEATFLRWFRQQQHTLAAAPVANIDDEIDETPDKDHLPRQEGSFPRLETLFITARCWHGEQGPAIKQAESDAEEIDPPLGQHRSAL
jgi:hypothetical protein